MDLSRATDTAEAPIRVLNVVDSLDVGGIREMLLDRLAELNTDRFKIGLLTLAGDLEQAQSVLPDHVTPLAADYRPPYGYGVLDYLDDGFLMRRAREFGADAVRQITSFEPAILHFHTNARDLGLAIIAHRQRPTALVFTDWSVRIRSDDYSMFSRFLLRAAYRRLYRHFHVISVGPIVARSNAESRFLNTSKEHVLLENSVDLQTFVPREGSRNGPLQIVYLGRIHPGKGVDTLVQAFSQVRPKDPVELLIVGPDASDGRIQRLAATTVRDPLTVRFLGAIPRAEVPALLRRAAIGVLPSRREGLPLALLEQMASGLPVVVTDIPELTDLVDDGKTGLVVRLDDADALARALQTLIGDPELRARLGQAARRSIEARQTGNPGVELMRLYDRIVPAT